jgi:hypothetical protein
MRRQGYYECDGTKSRALLAESDDGIENDPFLSATRWRIIAINYKMEFHTTQRSVASLVTRARSNFAAEHLEAAKYFHSVVQAVERGSSPSKDIFAPPQHRHCWYATVAFAVMAIEANVYDVMTAAERGEPTPLTRSFRAEDHRKSILDRYCLIHKVITGKKLDIGQGIGQAARALILLRDEITHYKTEFRDAAEVSKKLEVLLQPHVTLNPFRCGDIFFPEQCVSASSAAWAVNTSSEFMTSFAAATNVRPNI